MGKILPFSFFIILHIQSMTGQIFTSVIDTASGPIRGLIATSIEKEEYAAFKGIPYGKPPVGHLRFKPPLPIEAWTSIYDAVTEGNPCTQVNLLTKSVFGSEDCLCINVYTPHTEFTESISKPVMVWIYGGAFSLGDSNQTVYGPEFLLKEDVIFVSFNYRLGALGFLNLEHENATGNCALKDQNLALKWVKRNIARFGGNPNKITLFDESAGSVSVDLHVLSDMSVGLFSQSISMSGSTLNLFWGIQSRKGASEKGFKLGAKLGIKTRSKNVLLKALYKASAADIVTAADGMGFIPFRPTIENPNIARDQEKFLTKCAPEKYKSGNYTKGPHIVGFTADESLIFIESPINTVKSMLESIKTTTSSIPILSSITNAITAGIENLIDGTTYVFAEIITDLAFVLGIDAKQKLISRDNNQPIYYYRFSFRSNYSLHKALNISLAGAAHGDDIPYIFYMQPAELALDQPDIAITRRRMVKLWTNFAKYGNPTPDGEEDEFLGITWPDSRSSGVHLEIGKELAIGPRPTGKLVKILKFLGFGESSYFNDC